jgi:hypothetical protein
LLKKFLALIKKLKMKNDTREDLGATLPLTPAALKALINKGFRYVQVKGFTSDKRLDYISPRYLVLIPIKNLPDDLGKIEIYEPTNSQLLLDWADRPHDGMEVLISFHKSEQA